MKRLVFCSIFLLANTAFGQTDSLRAKVDSLFTRASAGELKYRNLVGPAVKALRELPGALPYLVEKLNTRDARERLTLVDSILTKMPEAVLPVCEATKSADRIVVRNASEVLSKMPDRRASPYLVKVLDNPDIMARGYAAMGLGKGGGEGAKQGLLKALADSVNFVRTQAAAGLGYLGDATTLPDLIKALQDDYYGVRFAAVNSLVKLKNSSLPYLNKALDSDVPMVRQLSAEALGKLQAQSAVPRLSRLLKSQLSSDRLSAIEALAQIDSPAARRALSSHREKDALVKARQEDLLKK